MLDARKAKQALEGLVLKVYHDHIKKLQGSYVRLRAAQIKRLETFKGEDLLHTINKVSYGAINRQQLTDAITLSPF